MRAGCIQSVSARRRGAAKMVSAARWDPSPLLIGRQDRPGRRSAAPSTRTRRSASSCGVSIPSCRNVGRGAVRISVICINVNAGGLAARSGSPCRIGSRTEKLRPGTTARPRPARYSAGMARHPRRSRRRPTDIWDGRDIPTHNPRTASMAPIQPRSLPKDAS